MGSIAYFATSWPNRRFTKLKRLSSLLTTLGAIRSCTPLSANGLENGGLLVNSVFTLFGSLCSFPSTYACYRAPSHDVMGYLSTHWPKLPSRQDQFGYHIFGYGAAISVPIGRDSRELSVMDFVKV
ncbi:hypothetical protein E2C01_017648 [Portunus trituberculatus]|uniref:Uncharacterized protein n=1 Tax=Portunus trituberculatus TaxID=210409 RepID=A0A5B7DUB0_PORTR|nr:hypothetical protein [Portunus trituberculatus]